jgi:hypothetical protein
MPASPEPATEPGIPPLPKIDTTNYEWIRDADWTPRWIDKANAHVAGSP